MTLAATLAVFAATSNSTAAWLEHRAKLVDSVLGYGVGKLPTRSTPDWIVENVAPGGVSSLIWNLSNGRFDINATVFYARAHELKLEDQWGLEEEVAGRVSELVKRAEQMDPPKLLGQAR